MTRPPDSALRDDLLAGLTVALVGVPQCMAFAAIAGLPPVAGIQAAVVMGVVNGLLSRSPKSIIGPAITTSMMVYAVLAAAAPGHPDQWPAVASLLAALVGGLVLAAALLGAGELVKFVSRSVLAGLTAGVGLLIFAAQIAPFLGLSADRTASLAATIRRAADHLDSALWQPATMGAATIALTLALARLGPRVPAAFLAIVIGGIAVFALDRAGVDSRLARIDLSPDGGWSWPRPAYHGPYWSDLLAGAASIALVCIIQTLAISKALAARSGRRINPRRELIALAASNAAASGAGGFPGAESISRTAINELAGARTRLSGVVAAVATGAIALAAAGLTHYVTRAAIAGLLMATAWSVVDRREVREILTRGGPDRIVFLSTLILILLIPIHWAVLIGIGVSVAMFLGRVGRLRIVEMTRGEDGRFEEQEIDGQTGRSAITMLQVEGPLFFAHAEELEDALVRVFGRAPHVVILRMRRTQQIDYSVIAAMTRAAQRYVASGGRIVICGLTEFMLRRLSDSSLGDVVGRDRLLLTTREVFGSAHKAIGMARAFLEGAPTDRAMFREAGPRAPDAGGALGE